MHLSQVLVHADKKGAIRLATSDFVPDLRTDMKTLVDADAAADLAANHVGSLPPYIAGPFVDAVIYPLPPSGRLAWKVLFDASLPRGGWQCIVDARTGEILECLNRMRHVDGSARVFYPNPVVALGNNTLTDQDDSDAAVPSEAYQDVTIHDLDGSGRLTGAYSEVVGLGSANEPSFTYRYLRNDDRFEEVMIYYHIEQIQGYIQSLGFNDINNRPHKVYANSEPDGSGGLVPYDADQSYYMSLGPDYNYMVFGSGEVDDAEDADIIIHEYGHSIQDNQVDDFGLRPQTRAMGEGFGDYLAASFYAGVNNGFQAACVGDWDAVSYSEDDRLHRIPHHAAHAHRNERHDSGRQ